MTNGSTDAAVTLGVVIELPKPLASQINAVRSERDWVAPGAIPEHITLLPPAAVASAQLGEVVEHLRRAAAGSQPFDVVLEGTDTFRPASPVVFLRVARGWSACAVLQQAVHRPPLDHALEYDFHPHVTVAHLLEPDRAAELDAAMNEFADLHAEFTVTEFVLYQRPVGGAWFVCERFRLGLGTHVGNST